jgi:hypothetical protein
VGVPGFDWCAQPIVLLLLLPACMCQLDAHHVAVVDITSNRLQQHLKLQQLDPAHCDIILMC